MTIDDLANSFGSVFSLLNSSRLLGVPLLYWGIAVLLFGLVVSFIKGKKE